MSKDITVALRARFALSLSAILVTTVFSNAWAQNAVVVYPARESETSDITLNEKIAQVRPPALLPESPYQKRRAGAAATLPPPPWSEPAQGQAQAQQDDVSARDTAPRPMRLVQNLPPMHGNASYNDLRNSLGDIEPSAGETLEEELTSEEKKTKAEAEAQSTSHLPPLAPINGTDPLPMPALTAQKPQTLPPLEPLPVTAPTQAVQQPVPPLNSFLQQPDPLQLEPAPTAAEPLLAAPPMEKITDPSIADPALAVTPHQPSVTLVAPVPAAEQPIEIPPQEAAQQQAEMPKLVPMAPPVAGEQKLVLPDLTPLPAQDAAVPPPPPGVLPLPLPPSAAPVTAGIPLPLPGSSAAMDAAPSVPGGNITVVVPGYVVPREGAPTYSAGQEMPAAVVVNSAQDAPKDEVYARARALIASAAVQMTDAQENRLSRESRRILSRIHSVSDKQTSIVMPKGPVEIEHQRQSDSRLVPPSEVVADAVKEVEGVGIKIAVRRPNVNVNYQLEKAYDALIAGYPETAIGIYKEILSASPNNKLALFGLATTYHRAGQLDMARPIYGRLLSIDPKNREALNNFLVLAADESPDDALEQLLKLESDNPDFSPIPAQIAVLYQKKNEYRLAIEKMGRALDLSPENLTYRYNMAIMLDRSKNWNQAADFYQELIQASERGEKIPAERNAIQERLTFIRSNNPKG